MRILYIPKPISSFEQIKFGLLYNHLAILDVRGIVSAGWRVPAFADTESMMNYLGGFTVAGKKLKETGTTYWQSPNANATNESKFNARANGYRESGVFGGLMLYFRMWNSDIVSGYGIASSLVYTSDQFSSYSTRDRKNGYGLRPCKSADGKPTGTIGTYTDPSGFIYRTIVINTLEWVADNVKTQHYSNGDPIAEVTDNATWEALTTGALCAPGNNWANV